MRNLKSRIAAAMLSVAVAGGGYLFLVSPAVPMAAAHLRDHPRLEQAFNSLRDAKEYLQTAPHDFHGHKADALHAIDEAMHRVSLCVDDVERKGLPENAVEPRREHAKLVEAVERLKDGREYLANAKGDFHGHRDEGLKAMDEAIHQINLCLDEH